MVYENMEWSNFVFWSAHMVRRQGYLFFGGYKTICIKQSHKYMVYENMEWSNFIFW